MSDWLKNVGGINNTQNIHQIKATEMDEYLNSIYNYKETPNVSGDMYFDKTQKVILGRMMECQIADEF